MLRLSLDSFGQALDLGGWEPKWRQVHRALTDIGNLPPECAYSRGDVLTFLWADNTSLARDEFIAHRRYRTVVMPVGGSTCVEVAPVRFLEPLETYSDVSDRGTYAGHGTAIELSLHEIGLFEVDEALRIMPQPGGQTALVHVTRESRRN